MNIRWGWAVTALLVAGLGCEDNNPAVPGRFDASGADLGGGENRPGDAGLGGHTEPPDAAPNKEADAAVAPGDATALDAVAPSDAAPSDAAPSDAAPSDATPPAPDSGSPPPVDTGVAPPVDAALPPPVDGGGALADVGGPCRDCDEDGVTVAAGDCDDHDPSRFPGQVELCDGVDDDCDGEVDGLVEACYTGAPDSLGRGLCVAGTRTCRGGAFEACVGQQLPHAEICGDALDNDCDGQVDQGCDEDGDGFGPSDGDCDDLNPAVHPGAEELCNNIDDDCDGITDDVVEICYLGPAGTEGVGQCRAGQRRCDGGELGPCEGSVLPGQEACGNGEDEDCDGLVDEDCDPDACPDVDLSSRVEVSFDCLGVGAGAVMATVTLVDARGAPVEDADVQIDALPEGGLSGVRRHGNVYMRTVYSAPFASTIRVGATVGCADGSRVALNSHPEVQVVPGVARDGALVTGGCAQGGNARVWAVDADTGAAIEGAWVLLGEAPQAASYQPVGLFAVRGDAPSAPNFGRTDARGRVDFIDLAGNLAGPTTLTVGAAGYENLSLIGLDASEAVVPLRRVNPPAPVLSNLSGRVMDFADLARDGQADVALVLGSFDLPFLAQLVIPRLLSRANCWDPVTSGFVGGVVGPVPVPGNLYVPGQSERVFGTPVPVETHRYTLSDVPRGVDDLVALAGKVPAADVVNLLLGGNSDMGVLLRLLTPGQIGVLREHVVAGDEPDLSIPLSVGLRSNARCVAAGVPAGTDVFCVAAGDWSGADGTGRLFPMGLATAAAATVIGGAVELPLTTVAPQGSFRGVGYLGAVVALFGDPAAAPAGLGGAVSAALDRGGLAADGGEVRAAGFLAPTSIAHDGLNIQFDAVGAAGAPPVDLCAVEIHRTISEIYNPGACGGDRAVGRDVPVWSAYVAGDAGGLSLPRALPAGWPRAGQSGLVDVASTPERDRLTLSVRCMSLGLAPDFDFNASNFRALIDGLTHVSSNRANF